MIAVAVVGGLGIFLALWWALRTIALDHIEGGGDVPGWTYTPPRHRAKGKRRQQ